MNWKVTEQPASPVSLSQAKTQLRVQHNLDDSEIIRLISAAVDYCEEELDLDIIDQ